MYRQSLMMKEKETGDQEQFLTEMGSLPVVQSALSQVLGVYSRTKDHNRLLRFTLDTAESGVTMAVSTAMPIVSKLPVDRLNSAACHQLDQLKASYPIITKPTDQVTDKVLSETANLYAATLKPTVDRVVAVKQTGVDSVSSVHQYGVKKVNGVKTFTADTLQGAAQATLCTLRGARDRGVRTASALLATPYGRVVAGRVDNAVQGADTYVDKYLPPTEEELQNGGMEVDMAEGEVTTLTRVQGLTDKVRRRMMARSLRELKNVKVRSEEMLSKLSFTVDLIEYARTHVDSARARVSSGVQSAGHTASQAWQDTSSALRERVQAAQTRLGHVWTEVTREEGEEGVQEDASKFERQLYASARHLTHSLRTLYSSLGASVRGLPSVLQDRVSHAGAILETLTSLLSTTKLRVQDIPQISLDNVRLQVQYMQEVVTSLADTTLDKAVSSPALNWAIPSWLEERLTKGQPLDEEPPIEETVEQ